MCFLNTEKVPLGECCAISETCEMFTFLMALTMPNYETLSLTPDGVLPAASSG
jgi:hypothetical protein